MPEITTDEIRAYLNKIQGQNTSLRDLRINFNILAGSKSFDTIRTIMFRMVKDKLAIPLSKDGEYRVVKQVLPVRVFTPDREKKPIYNLVLPRDFDTGDQIIPNVIFREGDAITIGGVKSKGKTTLALNFLAENIDKKPILMGNEYTQLVSNKDDETEEHYEPAPRFLNRLIDMQDRYTWTDEQGNDRFTLLPVSNDYHLHVVKDKFNIVDWINLTGDFWSISNVLGGMKANVGRGMLLGILQKGEGKEDPRGGQFVRDFSDLELLLDGYGENEDDVLLTVKGCKERVRGTPPIAGRRFAYTIVDGINITNFREVMRCPQCRGMGFGKGGTCDRCNGIKYVDKPKPAENDNDAIPF